MKAATMSTLLTTLTCIFATNAHALSLLASTGFDSTFPDAHFYIGGSSWPDLNSEINSTFETVTVVNDLSNLDQLLAHDRLWVDLRVFTSLTPNELTNIQQFIATGRRFVFMGENNVWADWNSSMLELLGGSWTGQVTGNVATALNTHPELTAGVGSIDFTHNAHGTSLGGTPLFDDNWAMLWHGQALTILDVGVFARWEIPANATFGRNVVAWLAVPEPATGYLLTLGAIALSWRFRAKRLLPCAGCHR